MDINYLDSIEINSSQYSNHINSGVGKTDANGADFQQILQLMNMGMSLQGSSESGSSGIFGSMNSFLLPLMMQLMDQIMSANLAGKMGSEVLSLQDAQGFHINQFSAERQVGGDGINSNCGPAALAMALTSLNIGGISQFANTTKGNLVDLARRIMVEESWRDGVDANGVRLEAEHNGFTSLAEIARGAENAGAGSMRISPDSQSILRALRGGQQVIVSGTFRNKSPLPWTGDRRNDFNRAPGGATEHFVLVSGYDSMTGQFIVNDPARNHPHLVESKALEYFMIGNEGALAISNRNTL